MLTFTQGNALAPGMGLRGPPVCCRYLARVDSGTMREGG